MAPSVHVIIVNWNSGTQLRECLDSFAAVSDDRVTISSVTVVDNASSDGSCDALPGTRFPLTLIRNAENRGFAAACNQGAAGAQADFLLFLNPDTRLLPGSLERPALFLKAFENAETGIVGIQLIGEDGEVARNTTRFPTPLSLAGNAIGLDKILPSRFPPHFVTDWAHDEIRNVDQVMGAFMMIRRELFEALSGFDERFFVYFEDLDLAIRARSRGANSVYLASAQAFHRGQGTTASAVGMRTYLFAKSRILFARKHFSLGGAALVIAATLLIEPVARSFSALRNGPKSAREVLAAFAKLWANLPEILKLARR